MAWCSSGLVKKTQDLFTASDESALVIWRYIQVPTIKQSFDGKYACILHQIRNSRMAYIFLEISAKVLYCRMLHKKKKIRTRFRSNKV